MTDGGNGNGGDHGDWANAQLTCSADTTTPTVFYLSDRTWTSMANGWGPVEKDRSNGEAGAGRWRADLAQRGALRKGPRRACGLRRAVRAQRRVRHV